MEFYYQGFNWGRFLVVKLLYNYKCPSVYQLCLGGNAISRPLFKIEVLFFLWHSSYIWAYFLQIFYPLVCRPGFKRQKYENIETFISRWLFFKIEDNSFFVKIPLINHHLLYEYFVCWSVRQATKGIDVRFWENATPN